MHFPLVTTPLLLLPFFASFSCVTDTWIHVATFSTFALGVLNHGTSHPVADAVDRCFIHTVAPVMVYTLWLSHHTYIAMALLGIVAFIQYVVKPRLLPQNRGITHSITHMLYAIGGTSLFFGRHTLCAPS